jgi:hypothetical protein
MKKKNINITEKMSKLSGTMQTKLLSRILKSELFYLKKYTSLNQLKKEIND